MSGAEFLTNPDRGCAPGTGTTYLFTSEDKLDHAKARKICGGCPVRQDCLEYAIRTDERWHVWGGVLFSSDAERIKARAGHDPRPTRDRVKELWEQGLTDPQIGDRLGIDPSSAWAHRQRQGLPAHFDLRAPRTRQEAA